MLLPQSSAFAALKNRLNSVSAIGYLHIAPRTFVSPHVRQNRTKAKIGMSSNPQSSAAFDRPNRLKPREEGIIKWNELLEKFRSVQDKAKKSNKSQTHGEEGPRARPIIGVDGTKEKALPDVPKHPLPPNSADAIHKPLPAAASAPANTSAHKAKASLGHLSRFAGNVGGRKGKK